MERQLSTPTLSASWVTCQVIRAETTTLARKKKQPCFQPGLDKRSDVQKLTIFQVSDKLKSKTY